MTYPSTPGYILVCKGPGSVPVYTDPKTFLWTYSTTSTQDLYVQNAYVVNSKDKCVLTLQLNPSFGDTIKIVAGNENNFIIAQHDGQQIVIDYLTSTTIGVLGFLTNTRKYNTVELICITAGLKSVWLAQVTGIFTVL